MQAELQALQPQLVATVAEVEQLMERIAHDKKHEVRHVLCIAVVGMQAACRALAQIAYDLCKSLKTTSVAPCIK